MNYIYKWGYVFLSGYFLFTGYLRLAMMVPNESSYPMDNFHPHGER